MYGLRASSPATPRFFYCGRVREFDANALRLKDPVRRGRGHPRSELQLIGTARRSPRTLHCGHVRRIRRECVEFKGPGASRARTPAVRTGVNRNRTAFATIFTLRPCAVEFDANALRLKDPGRRGRGHPRSALWLIGTARRSPRFLHCGHVRRNSTRMR